MKAVFETVGAMFITLLPPRYRSSTHLRGAALASGIAQTVLMVAVLVIRFALFFWQKDVFEQSGLSFDIIVEAGSKIGDSAAYGSGLFLLVNFITRPLNM